MRSGPRSPSMSPASYLAQFGYGGQRRGGRAARSTSSNRSSSPADPQPATPPSSLRGVRPGPASSLSRRKARRLSTPSSPSRQEQARMARELQRRQTSPLSQSLSRGGVGRTSPPRRRNINMEEGSPSPPRGPSRARGEGAEIQAAADDYMHKHRLVPLLQSLTTELIVQQPENPLAFMRAHLAEVMGIDSKKALVAGAGGTRAKAPPTSVDVGVQTEPAVTLAGAGRPSTIGSVASGDSSGAGGGMTKAGAGGRFGSPDFGTSSSSGSSSSSSSDSSSDSLGGAESDSMVDEMYSSAESGDEKRQSQDLARILNESADVRSFRKEQVSSIRSKRVKERKHRPRAMSSASRPSSATKTPPRKHSVKETFEVKMSGDSEGDIMVNQYQVMELLGKGAFGEVFRVIDTESPFHHQFAMKVLRSAKMKKKILTRPPPGSKKGKTSGNDPSCDPRHELAIMKKLSHPNVVKLREVMTDTSVANKMYFVMEFLPFGTVMEGCPAGEGLEIEATYVYMRDIVYGLEYLHHQGVIHRDLKPDNLLIDAQGVIKITDFGVSHVFEGANDSLSSTLGTPAYFAPELCTRGQEVEGKAVDVWALGVCLYEFLFGKLPFVPPRGINPFATQRVLFQMIRENEIVVPDDVEIDEDLEKLLFKLLEKDPHKRVTIAKLKKDAWLCQHGDHPMLDQALGGSISVTQKELDKAITRGFAGTSAVVYLAKRWRRRALKTPEAAGGGAGDAAATAGSDAGSVPKTPSPIRRLVLDKDKLTTLSEVSTVEQIIRTSGSSVAPDDLEGGSGLLAPGRSPRSPASPRTWASDESSMAMLSDSMSSTSSSSSSSSS